MTAVTLNRYALALIPEENPGAPVFVAGMGSLDSAIAGIQARVPGLVLDRKDEETAVLSWHHGHELLPPRRYALVPLAALWQAHGLGASEIILRAFAKTD